MCHRLWQAQQDADTIYNVIRLSSSSVTPLSGLTHCWYASPPADAGGYRRFVPSGQLWSLFTTIIGFFLEFGYRYNCKLSGLDGNAGILHAFLRTRRRGRRRSQASCNCRYTQIQGRTANSTSTTHVLIERASFHSVNSMLRTSEPFFQDIHQESCSQCSNPLPTQSHIPTSVPLAGIRESYRRIRHSHARIRIF